MKHIRKAGAFRLYMICVSLSFCFLQAMAQTTVDCSANAIRGGDTLFMQRMEYADAGVSGKNVTWDFSRLGVVEKDYTVKSFSTDGMVVQNENGYLLGYKATPDTLTVVSIENALQKTTYSHPIISLVYPFRYGDKAACDFSGRGRYCDRYVLHEQGRSETEADASGTLIISEKDTLYNVLRVHERRKSLIAMAEDCENAETDTTHMERTENIWSWYAAGFRYPVFRTTDYCYSISGIPINCGGYAVRFIPEAQRKISDEVNEETAKKQGVGRMGGKVRCRLKVIGDVLNVNYECDREISINFTVTDVMGVVYDMKSAVSVPDSASEISFSLSGLRHGQYVLYINAGGIATSEKFTYK